MSKDQYDDKSKPNLLVLVSMRIGGKPVFPGTVIRKTDFTNKSVWQNLANMEPPKVEETSDPVKVVSFKTKPQSTEVDALKAELDALKAELAAAKQTGTAKKSDLKLPGQG